MDFRDYVVKYGVYVFAGFIALVFLAAIASAEPKGTGWKLSHDMCTASVFTSKLDAQNFLLNHPHFVRMKKENRARLVEHTDNKISVTWDYNKDGVFGTHAEYEYSKFPVICVKGWEKKVEGKNAKQT